MTGGCGLHPLARDHYIPLRRQLAADLEAGIRDGQVRPGAHLPSSRDLARLLSVDRGTVGAALARLRRRNLIELHSGQRPRAAIGLFRDWPEAGGRSAARHFSAATTRPTARQATLALLRGAHAGGGLALGTPAGTGTNRARCGRCGCAPRHPLGTTGRSQSPARHGVGGNVPGPCPRDRFDAPRACGRSSDRSARTPPADPPGAPRRVPAARAGRRNMRT
ncbi:GntR family transcriptional regulator [Candidatus Palauibacter sp.]|uniref:GntR family transcriptional regulator n=1 Tax=Candidatus Palauibacter sp. TaxID=3101350 RepID=UPI003CC600B0